jgi:D-glycero-D-manno-heptose 1,7-bisphosphate phosphatase
MRRAVFLDRDGVLNRVVTRADGTVGSPRLAAGFSLLPGVAEAVARLRAAGFAVVVVTNQPDVARGRLAREELERMHAQLMQQMPLDGIFICPHDDGDACKCRKPLPGLLLEAARRLRLDLAGSFLIGDSAKDVAAGSAAGCRTILVGEEARRSAVGADWTADDLPAAAALVLRALQADAARRLLEDFEREAALRPRSVRRAETVPA